MKWPGDRFMLAVLVLDAVLLAIVELFFLPLRVSDLGRVGRWLSAVHSWPVPISIVLALVSTPLLVLAAGRYAKGTFGVGLPLFGWLFVCLVLGLGSPGGGVVLIDDWRSFVFLLAGALSGAAALGKVLGGKVSQPN